MTGKDVFRGVAEVKYEKKVTPQLGVKKWVKYVEWHIGLLLKNFAGQRENNFL